MICKDVVRQLHEYLDGELTRETADQIQNHLQQCGPCRKFVESYRKTIRLFQRTLDKDLPPEESKQIWQKLEPKIKP